MIEYFCEACRNTDISVCIYKCILKLIEGCLLFFCCCFRPLHLSYSFILLGRNLMFMVWDVFRGFLFGVNLADILL